MFNSGPARLKDLFSMLNYQTSPWSILCLFFLGFRGSSFQSSSDAPAQPNSQRWPCGKKCDFSHNCIFNAGEKLESRTPCCVPLLIWTALYFQWNILLLRSSLLFKAKGVTINNVENKGHFWTQYKILLASRLSFLSLRRFVAALMSKFCKSLCLFNIWMVPNKYQTHRQRKS